MASRLIGAALTAAIAISATAALSSNAAAQCSGGGEFPAWLDEFRREAAASGISAGALSELDNVGYDQKVIDADRRQSVFSQSFLEFAGRMVADYRMSQGKQSSTNMPTPSRASSVNTACRDRHCRLWAGDGFRRQSRRLRTLQSLATLAYDCRRPELFRAELLAALTLLDRGDLEPADLKGAWAGEVGQMRSCPPISDLASTMMAMAKQPRPQVPDVLAPPPIS